MDFMPTSAQIIGAKLSTDRPIDGVDQTDVLFVREVEAPLLALRGDQVSPDECEQTVTTARPSDWHRTAARTRYVLGQCAHRRLSEGI
jgi:hypothetical protein